MINTGTTIVTFLMVFPIQNTQNRDGAALIRVNEDAPNKLLDLEDLTEVELEHPRGASPPSPARPRMRPCNAKLPTASMQPEQRLRGPGPR
jgi:hypothetical protein